MSPEPAPAITDLIETSTQGGLLQITLNRPDAANALTGEMRDHLADIFLEASSALGVRAVLLGATGKAFCTGADLRGTPTTPKTILNAEIPEDAPKRPVGSVAQVITNGWQRLVASVLDCQKPVVCALQGTAAGGGAHLALACDLVVMGESAKLIEVFIRRGIIPDAGGCYLLPRLVGLARAKELMFFGDDIPASKAGRIGLVNEVVPDPDVAKTALEWAQRLAGAPTKSIAMTKWLLNRSFESDRATAFSEEAWSQEVVMNTHDAQEGVKAFVERRDPEFTGW